MSIILATDAPRDRNYLGRAHNVFAMCEIIDGAKTVELSDIAGGLHEAEVKQYRDGIAIVTIGDMPFALFGPDDYASVVPIAEVPRA